MGVAGVNRYQVFTTRVIPICWGGEFVRNLTENVWHSPSVAILWLLPNLASMDYTGNTKGKAHTTPPRTVFEADFVDNEESVTKRRVKRLGFEIRHDFHAIFLREPPRRGVSSYYWF